MPAQSRRAKSYDILFTQSVGGLAKGAQVTYSGVPVGQVDLVELDSRNPEVMRVRMTIADRVPVLAPTNESVAQNSPDGTTASLAQSGFTGPILIELNTPRSLAPGSRVALETPGPYGEPLIPPRAGRLRGDPQQRAGGAGAIPTAGGAAHRFLLRTQSGEHRADPGEYRQDHARPWASAGRRLRRRSPRRARPCARRGRRSNGSGSWPTPPTICCASRAARPAAQLRRTLEAAQRSLEELRTTIGAARPGIQSFSERTLPDISSLLRDLRATSESLRNVSERLERSGVGGIIGGGDRLPDYRPGSAQPQPAPAPQGR